MFTHVVVGTDDIEASRIFYDATLGTLGIAPARNLTGRLFYTQGGSSFLVSLPIDGAPACPANGGTIGFAAASADMADAWHAAGLASGGSACEDPPGVREGAAAQLYLAYLRDPAGNKLCAMHRMPA